MKKICFFINNLYTDGGTERVVLLIANQLKKNYEVSIVSLYKTAEKAFFNLNGIHVINIYETQKEYSLKKDFRKIRKEIKEKLKKYQFDYFICAGVKYVLVTDFMRKKAKYISWDHMNSFISKKFDHNWIARKVASKIAYKNIVLTDKDKKNNQKLYGSEKKIVRIYNPVNAEVPDFPYKSSSKKIVTVGRFVYQKGYDNLIEVAKKVFERHPDWIWDIYGVGEDFETVKEEIKRNSLEKNIILKGNTCKMLELYNEYAFYVMTSRYEGFPMVNIEALQAKLPIVSFDCPCGPSEQIIDGKNGFLIENFDREKMVEKINFLIEHPEVRKAFSENTKLSLEKLKLNKIINEWKEILV